MRYLLSTTPPLAVARLKDEVRRAKTGYAPEPQGEGSVMTERTRTRARDASGPCMHFKTCPTWGGAMCSALRGPVSGTGKARFAFGGSDSLQQTLTGALMAIGNSGGGRVAFIRYVLALLISALCVIDAAAFSFPVTYMETATISGSLNGVDFLDAQITITGSGDTANITHGMPCCFANRLGVSTVIFDLAGFGTGTFTDLVGVVVNQTNTGGIPGAPETGISGAGFSDFTSNFLILWTLDP